MDRKSKILFSVFFLLVMGSIGLTYYKYVIKQDYLIVANAPCDPNSESCFYMTCAEGYDTCSSTESNYYKKVEKKVYNIKMCDPSVDGCNPMVCAEDEKNCTVTTCSVEDLEEGESCSTSIQE